MIEPAHMKLPVGGPAWLRAMADDKEEMANVLPAETPERKREDGREIIGLRDAADRMAELEELVQSACAIAERRGADTAWGRFKESAAKLHLNGVTARIYRLLPDDPRDDEIHQLIEELRAEEGASVLIRCKNPDFNGLKNEAIVCQASFTGWKEERFDGDTLVECLRSASKAQSTRPMKSHVANPIG